MEKRCKYMSMTPGTFDRVRERSDINPLAALYPVSLASTNFAAAWISYVLGTPALSVLLVAVGLLVLMGAASRIVEN